MPINYYYCRLYFIVMNICFIMYPWERIDPKVDSSLRMIHEAVSRGYKVGIVTPQNLTIRENITYAFCKMITVKEKISTSPAVFYKQVKFKEQMLPLGGFDAIFMRDNPPIDNNMLNFLDSVKEDTFIVNSVEGLREANNKIYTAALSSDTMDITPATHVSKNKEYLKRVIKESKTGKMILKPLNGFGGRGVILIERSAMSSVSSLLDFYIDGEGDRSNYVILQEFVEGAEKGDVRILMLNGEPIGAMKRVPADGDNRSNVHAGGTVQKHVLTKEEKLLCKKIGPKLVANGLYFVGLDVISNKLIEVNVCSPGGITRINKLNRVKLQQNIMDFVETVVESKNSRLSRKSQLKKHINEI